MRKIGLCCLFLSAALLLASCLGASMDITLRADGSGRIQLEYRVSQLLEGLGRLDGNEGRPAVPVGREDLLRTVDRIEGLSLTAFSSGDRSGPGAGRDLVTTATLDFDRTEALLEFIGSSGGKAELVSEGGRNVLRLTMLEAGSETVDARLLSMMEEFFTGYNISISLQAPRDVGIRVIPDSPDGAVVEVRGRKAGFSVETSQLPALSEGLELEFTW